MNTDLVLFLKQPLETKFPEVISSEITSLVTAVMDRIGSTLNNRTIQNETHDVEIRDLEQVVLPPHAE